MTSSTRGQMKVGDFSVDMSSPLGSGAMGVVHPATDPDGKKVAAKRICGKSDQAMRRISKDLHKLLQLDHPNIVKFYKIFPETSTIWMLMELCEHKDLNDFLRKQNLNKHEKFKIMVQMAEGVEYLHKNNIIHRDIKPSNILVSSVNPIVVKFTDFDFSKFLEEHFGTSLMTSNVGTPAFKAPEFYLRNAEIKINYHRNVDIFALGLTYLAMIQENKRLMPQIETPIDVSDLHQPIGRVIADRSRYNKKPLDVIPEEPQLTNSASASVVRYSVEAVSHEVVMKKLIRQMTHFEPKQRLSAAEVVQDLHDIRKTMNHEPQDQSSAAHVTVDINEATHHAPENQSSAAQAVCSPKKIRLSVGISLEIDHDVPTTKGFT